MKFEECVTSVNSDSDMFDEKKVFNASVSKIICTLPDFESLEKLVDEAFTIWDVHLVESFEKLENKIDRDDFIKLTTDLSGLALLIPKVSNKSSPVSCLEKFDEISLIFCLLAFFCG